MDYSKSTMIDNAKDRVVENRKNWVSTPIFVLAVLDYTVNMCTVKNTDHARSPFSFMFIRRKAIKFLYTHYTFFFRTFHRIGHFSGNIVNDHAMSILWKQYITKKLMIRLKLHR